MNVWRHNQSCPDKHRHLSRKEAKKHKQDMLGRQMRHGKVRGHLVVYECMACGGWHVGNDSDRKERLQ